MADLTQQEEAMMMKAAGHVTTAGAEITRLNSGVADMVMSITSGPTAWAGDSSKAFVAAMNRFEEHCTATLKELETIGQRIGDNSKKITATEADSSSTITGKLSL